MMGKAHPLEQTREKMRQLLLNSGFDEIINRTIIKEDEIYSQYGEEAPVILDRIYYLAGLPRYDIALGQTEKNYIEQIIPNFSKYAELQEVLRGYREGTLEADDFAEELVTKLEIENQQANKLIKELFSKFTEMTPAPTKSTLRSHMTGAWFGTIAELQKKKELPIRLFSIGKRYRREQHEDAHHLRVHSSISLVLVDKNYSLEKGRKLTKKLLEKIGFKKVTFELKKATSNYYETGSEEEVFAEYNGKQIEIGDIGMYSQRALDNYKINHTVFNLGIGLERICMILNKYDDIRELVYPQFYQTMSFTDKDISEMITITKQPSTDLGKEISKCIETTATENANAESPCEFTAYEDDKLLVTIVESEEKSNLMGPAFNNYLYIYDGNIYGIPDEGSFKDKKIDEVKEKGIKLDISFIKAVADQAAFEIENNEQKEIILSIKNIKSALDSNIQIPNKVTKFINSQNKRIMVRGPMFTTIKIKRK